MKVYNKLVRDNIPEIMINNGAKPVTRILSNEEYLLELNKKLLEEVKEYTENNCVEELADIQEVILAIANTQKFQLDKVRNQKKKERGAFEKKLYLTSVE